MEFYVGMDVSLEETSICVVDGSGEIVCEGTVISEPENFHRVGLWPQHALNIVTTGSEPTSRAVGPLAADLVGSEPVCRHPHCRARSAPQCGVSRGPRAYRVRVPISGRVERTCAVGHSAIYAAVFFISAILWNSARISGWCWAR